MQQEVFGASNTEIESRQFAEFIFDSSLTTSQSSNLILQISQLFSQVKSFFRKRAWRRTRTSPPALCRWKVCLTPTNQKHSLGESRPRCLRCIVTHVVEAESYRGLIRSRCATVLFRHRRLDRRFVSWPFLGIKHHTTDARSVGCSLDDTCDRSTRTSLPVLCKSLGGRRKAATHNAAAFRQSVN